jgi:hypothetical protein
VDERVAGVPAITLFRDPSEYQHVHDPELRARICALESKAGAFWGEANQHSTDMARLGAQLDALQLGAEGGAVTAERVRELEARNRELDRRLQAAQAEAAKCRAAVYEALAEDRRRIAEDERRIAAIRDQFLRKFASAGARLTLTAAEDAEPCVTCGRTEVVEAPTLAELIAATERLPLLVRPGKVY